MRQRADLALDAEIEHEGRAGEARARSIFRVRPAAAVRLRHELRHGMGEVAVDDHGIGRRPSRRRPRRRRPRRSRRAPARQACRAGSRRPCAGPARAMASETAPQPPTGWKTPCSYSRKERIVNRLGQRNGRHAEIFGLEREGEAHPRVGEVAAQVAVDAAMRPQVRQGAQHAGDAIAPGWRSPLQHRPESLQLGAVVVEEGPHVAGVGGERRAISASRRSRSGVARNSPPPSKMRW